MASILKLMHETAEKRGMKLRTRDEVIGTLAQCKLQKSDLTMARMMVKFGRLTDDARQYCADYLALAAKQ